MKKNFFKFLLDELPTAIEGYYPPYENKLEVSIVENKKLKELIKPYKDSEYFDTDLDIERCFFCLFRAIKGISSRLSGIYLINKDWDENELHAKEIDKIKNKFINRTKVAKTISLKKAVFYFSDKTKIELSGSFTDFFFEIFFSLFNRLEDKNYIKNDINIELSALLYFKRKYESKLQSSVKKIKREYKKQLSYDEYHERTIKHICKEIHLFLKKYSSITSKKNGISNDELRLIKDFISLTGLHQFEDIQGLRNWIIR